MLFIHFVSDFSSHNAILSYICESKLMICMFNLYFISLFVLLRRTNKYPIICHYVEQLKSQMRFSYWSIQSQAFKQHPNESPDLPVSLGGIKRTVISKESFIKHPKESLDQPCVKVLTFGEFGTITKLCSTRDIDRPLRSVKCSTWPLRYNILRFHRFTFYFTTLSNVRHTVTGRL